jgi:hypothetical protein
MAKLTLAAFLVLGTLGSFAHAAPPAQSPATPAIREAAANKAVKYLGSSVDQAQAALERELGAHHNVAPMGYAGHSIIRLKPLGEYRYGNLTALNGSWTDVRMSDDKTGRIRYIAFERGPLPFGLSRDSSVAEIKKVVEARGLGTFEKESTEGDNHNVYFRTKDGTQLKFYYDRLVAPSRMSGLLMSEPGVAE